MLKYIWIGLGLLFCLGPIGWFVIGALLVPWGLLLLAALVMGACLYHPIDRWLYQRNHTEPIP